VSHVGLRISDEFPEISFIMVCHSNVGFLSADPHAIRIMRENSVSMRENFVHTVQVGNPHRVNSPRFGSPFNELGSWQARRTPLLLSFMIRPLAIGPQSFWPWKIR